MYNMGYSTKDKCSRCGKVSKFTNRYFYAREVDGDPLLCNACRYLEKTRKKYHKIQKTKKIIKKDRRGNFSAAFKSKTGKDI